MGYTNAVSLNRLVKEASDGNFDAVIHAGGTDNYSASLKHPILFL